jgi:hypothetical protein
MHQEAGVGWSGRINGRGAGLTGVASAFIAGVVVSVGLLGVRGSTSGAVANGDQPRMEAESQATISPDVPTSPGVVLTTGAIARSWPLCAVPAASTTPHRNVDDYGTP